MMVLRYFNAEYIALLYPLISIYHITNQIADFGITTSFIKIGAITRQEGIQQELSLYRSVLNVKLGSIILVVVTALLFAPTISQLTFKQTFAIPYIRFTLLASAFALLANYLTSILQIQERFKILATIKIIPVILKFGTIVLLALLWQDAPFYLLFIAFMAIPLLTFMLGMPHIPLRSILHHSSNPQKIKELLHTSKWIYISAITVAGMGQVDILMVRSMLAPPQLAHLVGGQKLSSLIPLFTATLVTVLLPKISSKRSHAELNYFFRKTLLFIPIIITIYLIGIISADTLVPLLLGAKYSASISVFKYYLIGYALSLYITPTSLIVYALNKEHLFIMLNIAQFFINILGNYLLIPLIAENGAALTSSLVRLIGLFFVLILLYREGIMRTPTK